MNSYTSGKTEPATSASVQQVLEENWRSITTTDVVPSCPAAGDVCGVYSASRAIVCSDICGIMLLVRNVLCPISKTGR